MFCSVVILSPPYALLTYALPQDLPLCLWMVGGRVVVPLGQSWRVGILTDFMDSCAGDFEAKTLCWPVDHKPLFTKAYLDFIANLSAHQMDSPGRILGRVLPQGIRELPIFTTCSGQVLTLPELASPDQRQKYVDVWLAGEMSTVRRARAQDRFFSLAIEPPWSLRGNAILQQAVLKHLDQHGTSSMAMLRKGLGTGVRSALQALMDKGLVQEVESRIAIPVSEVPVSPLQLSAEQSGAVDQFTALLDSGQAHTGLLFGITSSGKTAVYLELARRCLALGRHVFLLAPEVAIALKLYEDAHAGLQNTAIYLYHGYLSPTQRQRIFMDLAQA
ncbi:MAG: primosomal protein N', partial [Desulfovibrionales bacterium]|nr:primosomal protein N' [Desulfovibrionales bacterium]